MVAHIPRLPPGGRLFAGSIITQIGRGNKSSADIYMSRTVEDAGPYSFVSILMRTLLIRRFFLNSKHQPCYEEIKHEGYCIHYGRDKGGCHNRGVEAYFFGN